MPSLEKDLRDFHELREKLKPRLEEKEQALLQRIEYIASAGLNFYIKAPKRKLTHAERVRRFL